MCLEKWVEVPAEWSLLVVVSLLGGSVAASLIWPGAPEAEAERNATEGEPPGSDGDNMNRRNS